MISFGQSQRGRAEDAAVADFLSGADEAAMDRDFGAFDSSADSMPDEDEGGIDASASAYDSDRADEWTGRWDTGAAERTGFGELGDSGLAGELGAECPPGPKLVPPTLGEVHPVTADCFAHVDPNKQLKKPQYSFPATFPPDPFPATPCCAPSNREEDCHLPRVNKLDGIGFRDAAPGDLDPSEPVINPDIIPHTEALLGAAISFLRQEMDIVRWVLCLVQEYVPRSGEPAVDAVLDGYLENVTALINGVTPPWPGPKTAPVWNGQPWAFTIVGFLEDHGFPAASISYDRPNGDGSIGVIVCADHSWIVGWRKDYLQGTRGRGLVAVASMAGTLLHELVHVWGKVTNRAGDEVGAWHQEPIEARACWDEPTMARTAFLWAVGKRYRCMSYPDDLFLASTDALVELSWGQPPSDPEDPFDPGPAPGSGPPFPDDLFDPTDWYRDWLVDSWRSEWTYMLDGAVVTRGSF